jgi:nucleoside-diphosphate-sugar epimerase
VHILITGSAGFIGYHLSRRLLAAGHTVTGLDAMTPYYDVRLKQQRHAMLAEHARFAAITGNWKTWRRSRRLLLRHPRSWCISRPRQGCATALRPRSAIPTAM